MTREEHLSKIKEYDEAYYNGNPIIDDQEYDVFRNEYIEKYGSADLDYVPGIVSNRFEKFKHTFNVSSLAKIDETEKDKLIQHIDRLSPVVIEPKLDGISIVVYPANEDHDIIFVTRGSGDEGEIINDFSFVKSNKEFTSEYPIRGEVVIKYSDFEKMNEYLISKNEKPMSNPRNSVTGILRGKDRRDLLKFLTFVAYDVIGYDKGELSKRKYISTHTSFEVIPAYTCNDPITNEQTDIESIANDRIPKLYNYLNENLPYPIDGLVVKTNQDNSLLNFGSTGHHPKNAFAYKTMQKAVKSVLRSVEWQLGKSGVLTPVGTIDPIKILGTTVTQVSLANTNVIEKLNLHIGDTVNVIKAKMIIPQIISAEHNDTNNIEITIPTSCPFCGESLSEERIAGTNKSLLFCSNDKCKERIAQQISFLGKKNILNIDGLSIETCRSIVNTLTEKIKDPYDIFNITLEDLKSLPRFGNKKASNIFNAIKSVKDNPIEFSNWLPALFINDVGHSVAKILLKHYDNNVQKIYEVLSANISSIEELTKIHGIGETIATHLIGTKSIHNWDRLAEYCSIKSNKNRSEDDMSPKNSKVSGLNFVLTGKMPKVRGDYEYMITRAGGNVQNAVNSKTNYLVIADTSSSSTKAQKARKLGTQLISPSELEEMLV